MSRPLTPRQGLVAFMATLAGPEADGLIELRHRRSDGTGMRQRFFDAAEPGAAAMAATVLSQTGDVYVGCALRSERAGGKDAVQHGWALWVDCDDARSITALEWFDPQPAIVIRSSSRGRHAYWPLERPLAVDQLERLNRRLAYTLRACQSAVTNAAAVLRPPATLNWKYRPPAAVRLEAFTAERFTAEAVAGGLPDPPITPPRRQQQAVRRSPARGSDPLLAIEPVIYIEALIGRQVRRDGKVACPFHPDSRPSLHAYSEPGRGWACYSAKCWRGGRPNGGDIYDLAGQLWGLTSDRDFPEVRRRLYATFLPGVEPPVPRRRRTATRA